MILPCPAQLPSWERAEGWGLPINQVILPSPVRWMASKESHHFHTQSRSCPVYLLPPGLAPVSVSASSLETPTDLTFPPLAPMVVEPGLRSSSSYFSRNLCTIFGPLDINHCTSRRWTLLREESRNICHYSLVLSRSLSSVRHSDQNALHTQSSLS